MQIAVSTCRDVLVEVLRESEQSWTNHRLTCCDQRSWAEIEQVDGLLFALDITADFIHGADQADVCLDEDVLPFRVEGLTLCCNTISGLL